MPTEGSLRFHSQTGRRGQRQLQPRRRTPRYDVGSQVALRELAQSHVEGLAVQLDESDE
jgi:hypothetical protein